MFEGWPYFLKIITKWEHIETCFVTRLNSMICIFFLFKLQDCLENSLYTVNCPSCGASSVRIFLQVFPYDWKLLEPETRHVSYPRLSWYT